MCVLVEAKPYIAVVDPGGAPGMPPQMGPNSFVFAFLLKSTFIAPHQPTQQCWHPSPMGNPGSATVLDKI